MTKQQETLVAQQGNSTAVVQRNHETDAPMLPVGEMERFNAFKPCVNEWIIQQTEQEAVHRRALERYEVEKVYSERLKGQVYGFLMGICGIIGGSAVAICGHPSAGATIASISIGTLALAFVNNKK